MRILSDVFSAPAVVIPDSVTPSLQLECRHRRSVKLRLLKIRIFFFITYIKYLKLTPTEV